MTGSGQLATVGGAGGGLRFYLGAHQPHWLARLDVPLFVSVRALRARRSGRLPARLPVARTSWALDSGAFTELATHGTWTITARQYAAEVRRCATEIGQLDWAAPQDWMCEPFILARTGLTVAEHQARTIDGYRTLVELDPELPFIPVLQGWTLGDYAHHLDAYAAAGVDLVAAPLVGLGSVCRRQATTQITQLVTTLAALGLRLHGFGVKPPGWAATPPTWSRPTRWPGHIRPAASRPCPAATTASTAWATVPTAPATPWPGAPGCCAPPPPAPTSRA